MRVSDDLQVLDETKFPVEFLSNDPVGKEDHRETQDADRRFERVWGIVH